MKKMIVTCVLLGSAIATAFSQHIELKGVVREVQSNEPLAFVNIVLQTPDSAFVTGAVSDDNGRFAIPKIKPGNYRLALSFMGYKTLYIEVAGLTKNLALPDILMEEEAVGLDAVTVTASATTSWIDRKLIFPTERQINVSSNGIDLLQQLMLSRILVNPMTREVSIPGGGEVQLRINGVRAEVNDIVALQPKDIIRVEYHDNPGLRYGNAEAVIDYIVRRHETGGNMGMNLRNTLPLKTWGEHNLNGRVSHKKSEFSANYRLHHSNINSMWRDNEENFLLPDGAVLQRREAGEPSHRQFATNHLNMAYNYLNEKRMFSATFRYSNLNQPYFDFIGRLYNIAAPNDYVQMVDRTKENNHNRALDLYYQENLKNDQTLVVNVVGTYNGAENTRMYQESRENQLLTDINNIVSGNKYSLIGEGIYEKKLSAGSLSAGLRHTQSHSDNTYRNGHASNTEMQQGETFFFGEWKGRLEKLDYMLGAGVTRSSFRQENAGSEYSYYTFNPRLSLFYPLSGQFSVRLKASVDNQSPSLSSLSAVEQSIDSLQIQRGNPDLKPFHRYQSELNLEWKKGIFYVNLQGRYQYEPSSIMEEKFWEGGKIVQTWNNQQSWQCLNTMLTLRASPFKEYLQIFLFGSLHHYVSHGNSYRHVYSHPYYLFQLNGNYRNLTASFVWQGSWPQVRGETMTGLHPIHLFSLGYKYRDMKLEAGIYFPFVNDFRMSTENWSKYASYRRVEYNNSLYRTIFLTYSWNFSFGRKYQSGQKRLNNADEDAGVMKAGK
ncbi:MAG: TonB-dependent receptor [Tannerella sp.]|jgi:hypothetical protein|nr:TonB-dependent receptor [Tannerella sp.]